MSRPHDWAQAICQPIGVIPGGSGNGLSASLLYRANEKLDVLNAAFSVAKGIIQKLDLATTINTKGNKIYSFLSLEWAFIADVDIESEKYRRPFGDLRFTISAIQKLLFCRKPFHGTLHYLPEDCNYKKLLKESVTTSQSATEGPRLDLLELTPSTEWKELSGHFDLFWGMNVSHASRDAIVTPQASPDDGFMHILILHTGSGSGNAQIKRSKLLRVLLSMETGKHVDKKYVTLIKTRAFKLQVHNPKDRLCVDGELVDGPEIQVEMHQQLGRILTLQPKKLVEIVQ
jgi:sphingosine kinase/centromere protein J